MPLTQDIVATYKAPGPVVERFLSQGRQEVRALIFAIIGCALIFVAQTPYQAREAQLDPEVPLNARLYWSGFFWVFIMPIVLYGFAAILWALSRLARRSLSGYAIRLTLFWALLASTPVILLMGLVAGFIGPGIQLQTVGLLWIAVFLWFWVRGLLAAEGVAA